MSVGRSRKCKIVQYDWDTHIEKYKINYIFTFYSQSNLLKTISSDEFDSLTGTSNINEENSFFHRPSKPTPLLDRICAFRRSISVNISSVSNPNFRFIGKTTTDRIDIALGSLFNVFVRSNFWLLVFTIFDLSNPIEMWQASKKIQCLMMTSSPQTSISFLYLRRRSWAWKEIQSRSLIIAHVFLMTFRASC